MKKTILKPFVIMTVFAVSLFGCAGSSNDAVEVDAEAEDIEYADEEPLEEDNEALANRELGTYDDMFGGIEDTENYDIMALARMDPNLSTFVELVDLAGLAPSMEVAGEVGEDITVFIPTNQAFEELDDEVLADLRDPANRTELIRVLKYHILPSEVPTIQFDSSQIIETEGEYEIPVSTEMNGTVVFVGGAQIVKPDVEAANGLIHVVNGIVDPSEFTDVTAD